MKFDRETGGGLEVVPLESGLIAVRVSGLVGIGIGTLGIGLTRDEARMLHTELGAMLDTFTLDETCANS